MKNSTCLILFAVLCLAQALISEYFLFSQYLVFSLLPAIIMSLPSKYGTPSALLFAFIAGFAVEFIGTSSLGLTSIALLPVALLRTHILAIVSGEDYTSHRDDPPCVHQSGTELSLTMILACLVFFLVYVPVDCAGTRPLGFVIVRTLLSTAASSVICILIAGLIYRKAS